MKLSYLSYLLAKRRGRVISAGPFLVPLRQAWCRAVPHGEGASNERGPKGMGEAASSGRLAPRPGHARRSKTRFPILVFYLKAASPP